MLDLSVEDFHDVVEAWSDVQPDVPTLFHQARKLHRPIGHNNRTMTLLEHSRDEHLWGVKSIRRFKCQNVPQKHTKRV